jgi:hypothetical protein
MGEEIMNQGRNTIFVSCGQRTQEEQDLGQGVEDLVNRTPGFCAYRAASVQDLQGLNDNIMEALGRCSGLVAVLHRRGKIPLGNDKDGETSSIWINQEIAILSYRRWLEHAPIPVKIFKEPEVALEGAMTSQIANPADFTSLDQVLEEVRKWLDTANFTPALDLAEFQRLVTQLDDADWMVIEAVAAGGGSAVSRSQVKTYLRDKLAVPDNEVNEVVRTVSLKFTSNNLLFFQHVPRQGDTFELNQFWQWELRREVGRRLAGRAAQPS